MILMAKKKPAPPKRYGLNTSIWLDPDVKKAAQAFVETHEPKTTLTAIIELSLKEYLERNGGWPLKS